MKITQVRLGRISTPLRVPFKTALRTIRGQFGKVLGVKEIHREFPKMLRCSKPAGRSTG